MFNRYLPEDREAFEDLYRPVEQETVDTAENQVHNDAPAPEAVHQIPIKKQMGKIDLKNLLKGFGGDGMGILPLLLLLFLIMDVDEDERLIIIILAFVLGI